MQDTIKIGGIERNIRLRYIHIDKILKRWNVACYLARKNFEKRYLEATSDTERKNIPYVVPNEFFFWAIWKCLVKRGFWIWKKPFKSMNAMIKEIVIPKYT